MTHQSYTLLVHCNDSQGIVSKITTFLFAQEWNILDLDQHVEASDDAFFMKVVFDTKEDDPKQNLAAFMERSLFNKAVWKIFDNNKRQRMALFVTKMSHCIYDILYRTSTGEWNLDIPVIISNHKHLEPLAQKFNIPFHHFDINKENKAEQEHKQLALLRKEKIDFVVLARYMQIISPTFIDAYPSKIINIHHSFLPAFVGAKPYHSAFERGVKIIGATSHYVSQHLDAGPIIEQDVARISHRDDIKELIRKGKDLEKIVLSRAIRQHITHNLMVYKNKTIVFA